MLTTEIEQHLQSIITNQTANLSGKNLSKYNVPQLQTFIEHNQNLEEINLSFNKFIAVHLLSIATSFTKNPQLKSVDFSRNCETGIGLRLTQFIELANVVGKSNVQELDLTGITITDNGMTLPKEDLTQNNLVIKLDSTQLPKAKLKSLQQSHPILFSCLMIDGVLASKILEPVTKVTSQTSDSELSKGISSATSALEPNLITFNNLVNAILSNGYKLTSHRFSPDGFTAIQAAMPNTLTSANTSQILDHIQHTANQHKSHYKQLGQMYNKVLRSRHPLVEDFYEILSSLQGTKNLETVNRQLQQLMNKYQKVFAINNNQEQQHQPSTSLVK